MKTKNFFLNVFLFTVMLFAVYGFGQSDVVFYGVNTNAIAVSFVDTNLSASIKVSIVADLQVCLREWGRGELRLRNKGDSVGYLDNSTRCPHYPENIEFPENVVSNGQSGLALQISKKVSTAYTVKFITTKKNAETGIVHTVHVSSIQGSRLERTIPV